MTWKKPKEEHIVYEALSAIADGRFELLDEQNAKCASTSREKFYSITYDAVAGKIMSNDNMAYYRDEVSYPMVAMLLMKGEFGYDQSILEPLKGIKWKDINKKNKNDYMKSVREALENLAGEGADVGKICNEVAKIFAFINAKELKLLGSKKHPPRER